MHHALRRLHELAGKHHIGLPLRIIEQGQQARIGLGARPAEGMRLLHHIGDQPARIAGLERLGIVHQQAKARPRRQHGTQRAKAVRRPQPATLAALTARPAARQKRPRAARQPLRAQPRHRMRRHAGVHAAQIGQRHAGILRRSRHSRHFQAHPTLSSSNSGSSARRLSHTPPPSSLKCSASPRRYRSARWRNRRGSVRSSSITPRS